MRNILPILIGLVVLFVEAATGNPLRGLIAGGVIGAMAWGAFAWKPGSGDSHGEPTASKTTGDSMGAMSHASSLGKDALPSFSFRELGGILAGSVAEGLTNHHFSVQELELVSQADIDLNAYKQELHLLQSASAFIAAGELISEPVTASEVKAGFVDYWTDAANSSPQMLSLRNSFQLRFPAYVHAIHADRTARDPDQLHFSQICQTFANFLGTSAGRSEASPKELVFAMMGLPSAYWEATRDSARLLFVGAKLPTHNS